MKKHFIPAFIFFIVAVSGGAQNRDNIWMLGTVTANSQYPHCGINFSFGTADTFSLIRPLPFFNTNAGICDTFGQELFYTNGIFIENRNHDTLLNSWLFNPGFATTLSLYSGLGIPQGCLIIPPVLNSSIYYLFHVSGESYLHNGQADGGPLNLSYSLVDMALDNGLGGIPPDSKGIYLIEDTVMQGRLTACRHANGRDWWVVTHENFTNQFYKILVTPDTLLVIGQFIGSPLISNDVLGMAVFSPDGSKYVMINNDNTAELYDFDRCTGELSNPVVLPVPDTLSPWLSLGGAFSPNSRFLYANTYKKVWQYDTWANDIPASAIKVAEWDSSTYNNLAMWFFQQQLAPDNRIYVSTYNGIRTLHVIQLPDSLGISCNLVQHDLDLPHFNISVPNHPNYDLGALAGSPCDTLNIPTPVKEESANSFSISPNPASTQINIVYSITQTSTLTITDSYGRLVKQLTLYPYFKNRIVYLEGLAQGVYLVSLQGEKERVSEKLVVQ